MHLPGPAMCSLQLVNDIVAERQGGKNAEFFSGIATEWRNRVQFYINAAGSPTAVQTWPDIKHKKNSFLNLYLSPTEGSVQGAMLDAMRAHDLMLCPACGEPGAPNTLDHYLPKGKYPHFCVTPYNLFPMCDGCQTNKKEKTGDTTNPRFFLHPYFDVFIASQVLELSIHPPFETPTFDLGTVAGLTPEQTSLVNRHTQELKIVSRYARFFRNEYQRLLRLTHSIRDTGQDVEASLSSFREANKTPTKNGWQHVFYAAILVNTNLLEFLKEGDLPDYL